MAEVDAGLTDLGSALRERRLTICVGPGLAELAGLPTPLSLARMLFERIRDEHPSLPVADIERAISANEDAEALEAVEAELGPARFVQLVERIHAQHEAEPPPLAGQIAALRNRLHSVYTTTLDRLIARAFRGDWLELGRARADTAQTTRVILSLCGRLSDSTSWVLTTSQHERSRTRDVDLREAIRATYRARTMLFVGFDGHRSALERILAIVADAHGDGEAPQHYVAASDEAWTPSERRSLRRRGLVMVPPADVEQWMVRSALAGREIIDFTSERMRHEHFFGREDVFDELDEQLRKLDSGWIVLTGGPGLGKSALIERWLTRREQRGELTAYHFIRRGHLNWAEPEVLRANLAAQIEQMFPARGDPDPDAGPSSLDRLLGKVAPRLVARGQKLVLLVDGLDEAMTLGEKSPIPQMFPPEVPAGVFVVVASRSRYPHLHWFDRRTGVVNHIDLDRRAESNDAAVRLYWAKLGPSLVPPLPVELQRVAIERAHGNLLHAVKLRELWNRARRERRAADVPEGFEGMLDELWGQLADLPDADLERAEQGLSLLCAAREALPLQVVEEILEWREGFAERKFLPSVREMLLEEPWGERAAYRPFHEGLRELVERKLPRAAKRNHALLAAYAAWPLEGDTFRRRYALRHRVAHQVEADMLEAAELSCRDVSFLTAKACDEQLGIVEVLRDVRMAADRQSPDRARRLRSIERVLVACVHWASREPEALPALLHDRLLTNAPGTLREMSWPERLPEVFPRLRFPLQKRGLSLVLEGHEGRVTSVAVLPDGRLVSGSEDRTLRVWDLERGTTIATLEGHRYEVTCVAALPDGRVVSGSWDKTLRVWDLESRTTVSTLVGHEGSVECIAVLPDGRVVSGSQDKTLRVWDLDTKTAIATLEGHEATLISVGVLPDGRVVSGAWDKTLRVWDLDTRTTVATLAVESYIDSLGVLPDGRVVYASHRLWVWEPVTGATAEIGQGYWNTQCLCVMEGRGVSGSLANTVHVWDIDSGAEVARLHGHHDHVSCVSVLPDGRVVSGSDDATLRVWDFGIATVVTPNEMTNYWPSSVVALPDGRILSACKKMHLWDLDIGTTVAMLDGHQERITCMVVMPDGRVVSASLDRTLRVWNIDDGVTVATLEAHERVLTVAVLSDRRIVFGSRDKTLQVWDIDAGVVVATLEGHEDGVFCVAVLSGNRVVSGSRDKTLRVWDLTTKECIATLEGHEKEVFCVAVLPDGRVVSGSADNTLRVWDVDNKTSLATLVGHENSVYRVAVLADGRIVSASLDRTLRVWNPENGTRAAEPPASRWHRAVRWIAGRLARRPGPRAADRGMQLAMATLTGHYDGVCDVAVVSASRVVSSSFDGTLRVWDLDVAPAPTLEGQHTMNSVAVLAFDAKTLRAWDGEGTSTMLEGHRRLVTSVAVLPGSRVVSSSVDGNMRVWDPSTGTTILRVRDHRGSVNCVAVLPDGRVVFGSDDKTLRVWDPSRQTSQTLVGHQEPILSVAVLPNGHIVSSSDDKTLRVWSVDKGTTVATFTCQESVSTVAVLPDGHIATVADGCLGVRDVDTGTVVATIDTLKRAGGTIMATHDTLRMVAMLDLGPHFVTSIHVLPNGRLVSGSEEGTVFVWDLDTRTPATIFRGHRAKVTCIATLPNGRIVSSSADQTLRVWEPDTGRVVASVLADTLVSCVAAVDDHTLVAGDVAGNVWFIDLPST